MSAAPCGPIAFHPSSIVTFDLKTFVCLTVDIFAHFITDYSLLRK
jgi:hypothetical protein